MIGLYDLHPFRLGLDPIFGQSMVEEDFDSCLFAVVVIWIVGDETDKTT